MSGNEWLAVGKHPLAAEGFRNILDAAMHYRNYSNNDLLEPLPEAAPPKAVVRSALFSCVFLKSKPHMQNMFWQVSSHPCFWLESMCSVHVYVLMVNIRARITQVSTVGEVAYVIAYVRYCVLPADNTGYKAIITSKFTEICDSVKKWTASDDYTPHNLIHIGG